MSEHGERIRLALVDDDPVSRAFTVELLARDGRFSFVAELEDGREAVERLADAEPDAVLLDLAMPGVSGMEALPLLREVAPDTAIVCYSSLPVDKLVALSRTAVADAVVSKSASAATLAEHLVAAVRRLREGRFRRPDPVPGAARGVG
jgi:two-component system, NarL family, nitrate/nitrite response regulator NarL